MAQGSEVKCLELWPQLFKRWITIHWINHYPVDSVLNSKARNGKDFKNVSTSVLGGFMFIVKPDGQPDADSVE
ncbi:hypothetical protein ACROYT_G035727 [Oculina patagonica]